MAFTGTPAAEHTERFVLQLYGGLTTGIGQYNRRRIANSTAWSQHSWGNALDIMVGGSLNQGTTTGYRNGDIIYAWLAKNKRALGIKVILWRVKNHHNHIHVDFWPTGAYTPPLSSTGIGSFRYSSGKVVSAQIQRIPAEGSGIPSIPISEEMNVLKRGATGPAVVKFQAALMAERPGSLPQFGADGDFGGETETAVKDVQRRYNLPQNGVIDGVLAALLLEYVADRVGASGGTVDQTARTLAAEAKELAVANTSKFSKVKAVL